MQERANSMQNTRLFSFGCAAAIPPLIISIWFLSFIPYSTDAAVENTTTPKPVETNQANGDEDEDFLICKHADQLYQDDKKGFTVLTGNVELEMSNGFLNADKVTLYRNVETDKLTETIAEGNVQMKEGQAIASSDRAVLNHIDDIVNLHDNVVVIQEEDRLEAAKMIFNRRTGVQTAEGKPVKITRPDGFLNGNRVEIYKNLETDEITKIIAQELVEMRDEDIFATSDYADLNQVDDTVDLRENVVVIQEEDRLEAKSFTYNRRTGKRVGKGSVRFRVRISQKNEDGQEPINEN